MENFKLLNGYLSDIVVSEFIPDLTIRLESLPDEMLKVEIKYELTSYDSICLDKIIKMVVPFSDYKSYSHYVLSNYNLLLESLDKDIMKTLKSLMKNFD